MGLKIGFGGLVGVALLLFSCKSLLFLGFCSFIGEVGLCAIDVLSFVLRWVWFDIEQVGMFLCLWMEMQMEDGRG